MNEVYRNRDTTNTSEDSLKLKLSDHFTYKSAPHLDDLSRKLTDYYSSSHNKINEHNW